MTAPILKHAAGRLTAISTKPRHTQLTPSSAIEHVMTAGTQRHRATAQDPSSRPLDPLENPPKVSHRGQPGWKTFDYSS